MTVKSFALTGTAFTVLVTLALISASSPEFKAHATTAAIIVLGIISLTGILVAIIAPLFPERPHKPTQPPERQRGTEHTRGSR